MLNTIAIATYLLSNTAHQKESELRLTSSALVENGKIPPLYTCDGKNISLPIEWSGRPVGTRSYAVIMSEADATSRRQYHWELYNIPGSLNHLSNSNLQAYRGGHYGLNSWRHAWYDGPCPQGGQHHYKIDLYALDTRLYFDHPVTANELLQAVSKHKIAEASMTATYTR